MVGSSGAEFGKPPSPRPWPDRCEGGRSCSAEEVVTEGVRFDAEMEGNEEVETCLLIAADPSPI